jgi:hypothetical protein
MLKTFQMKISVLENDRQRQHHRQEMFYKIFSQEIFVILYTGSRDCLALRLK